MANHGKFGKNDFRQTGVPESELMGARISAEGRDIGLPAGRQPKNKQTCSDKEILGACLPDPPQFMRIKFRSGQAAP